MVTCPTCGGDDLDLVERLGGDARILRCNRCGHQWQRGEVPKPAVPGQTTEQRLRARFPTVEDISSKRLKALRDLTTDPGRPRWSEYQGKFRDRFRQLFSQDGLAQMTVHDFVDFYISDAVANVGPAQFAADATLKELGPESFLESVRAALEYLLYEERWPLEQRLTVLVGGDRSPAVKGIREAILTKVLATVLPDRIFPALVYDSEEGSGKRQIAAAILGLNLPPRDRTDWTIGRLAIWSNDLFVDVGELLGFTGLPSAADFVWWLWKRHRNGEDIFPSLIGVEEFVDDDERYLRWVSRHNGGFVLNCERTPRAEYLVLHTTNCSAISGTPSRGEVWTGDYIKACSTSRQELVQWAEDRTGGQPTLCGLCFGP